MRPQSQHTMHSQCSLSLKYPEIFYPIKTSYIVYLYLRDVYNFPYCKKWCDFMQKIYTPHLKSSHEFKSLSSLLRPHYIEVAQIKIPQLGKIGNSLSATVIKSILNQLIVLDIHENVLILHNKTLHIVSQANQESLHNRRGEKFLISDYILKYHTYTPSQLSVRKEEITLLTEYEKNGNPNFAISPDQWIRNNPFFAILRPKPFYDRLLAHTLDKKGLFIKKWTLRAQHNYFHPSVNSGLPLTKKKDAIHEGTFMMHDMFHHVFNDALATGNETPAEQAVYIACRMMSEACTLVLADMIAVAHSGIANLGYDITKRQIYPLFLSLKFDPFDIETVRKTLYANCVYCLYGDTRVYKDFGADEDALTLYTSKYYKFFSGDFAWNEKNIKAIIQENTSNPKLRKYFASLDKDFTSFNTRSLAKKITRPDGKFSFNALFEIFWQQLVEVIYYQNTSDQITYQKTCYIKYLSGQMKIAHMYSSRLSAKKLIKKYPLIIAKIKQAQSSDQITQAGQELIEELNLFIEELESKHLLTPAEATINKLHVPLFPPVYVNYDENDRNYEKLETISTRLLGPYFPQEDFTYVPLPESLKSYYLQIVGT